MNVKCWYCKHGDVMVGEGAIQIKCNKSLNMTLWCAFYEDKRFKMTFSA